MAFFSCPSVHVRRALLHVVMCVRLSVRTQPRDFDFCRFPVTDCGVLKTLRTDLMEDETLRDQLCYPHAGKDICMSDADLIILMRSVDLDFVLDRAEGAALSGCVCVCVRVALTVLVLCVARSQLPAHLHSPLATDGLDTRAKWSDMLSGGEQQRVGMVRLLYHKPTYAIMVRVCVVDVGVFVLRFFVVCMDYTVLNALRCLALRCARRVFARRTGRVNLGFGRGIGGAVHAVVHRQRHHLHQCWPPADTHSLPPTPASLGRCRWVHAD